MTEIARVQVVFTGFGGAPGMATHYFRKIGTGGWTLYDQLVVDDVRDAYTAAASLWPAGWTATVQGDIDILEDTTGEIQTTLTVTPRDIEGTAEVGYGPLATGLLVAWHTAGVVKGRHVRGRTFLVPVREDANDADGSPTTTAIGLAETLGADLLVAATGLLQPVIWSRPKLDRSVDPPEYFRYGSSHTILTRSVSDKFAVLRSRRD